MELTVGAILEGKVKSITGFGAFIALPENKTGLVHISEVANAYVSDIRQHLTEGQDVKVMVIGCENGKINLSIKRLEPKGETFPQRSGFRRDGNSPREGGQNREGNPPRQGYQRPAGGQSQQGRSPMRQAVPPAAPKTADQLFEEKLKAFMSESDSKISTIKQYSDRRTKSRRR